MLNRDLRVYLVNQQNHVPDWKASHSFFMRYMYIQTVNFIMAIWAFPCEIYLFATNICEISDSIANFEKRKKIWFSYLNHPQSRWTVWKSQGGWESKEVSIISPLVEMGLIHMPKSRGGGTVCWNGVLHWHFLGIKMHHWNKCLNSLLWDFFSFRSTL